MSKEMSELSQAHLFLKLFDEYSDPLMHDALATLEQWQRDNGDDLEKAAERWANAVYLERDERERDDDVQELNDARRLVVCFYHKLLALGEGGHLGTGQSSLLAELKSLSGRELLLGVVRVLDLALERARHGHTTDNLQRLSAIT